MDRDEILALLTVAEKASAHGTLFVHIRDAALARLREINEDLAPEQPEPVTPIEGDDDTDNPATVREGVEPEPIEEVEDDDGVLVKTPPPNRPAPPPPSARPVIGRRPLVKEPADE